MAQAPAGGVDASKLALVLGLSVREIYRYADEGIIKKLGKGQYNFVQSIQSYAAHLRDKIQNRGESDAGQVLKREEAAYKKAKLEKLQSENELLQIEIAAERKKYVPAEIFRRVLVDQAKIVVDGVSILPDLCEQGGIEDPRALGVIESSVMAVRTSIYEATLSQLGDGIDMPEMEELQAKPVKKKAAKVVKAKAKPVPKKKVPRVR